MESNYERKTITVGRREPKLHSVNVAISKTHEPEYCMSPPFHPSYKYPEYPFNGKNYLTRQVNRAYECVRQVLYLLGLDRDNYDQKSWNPLGQVIKTCYKVLIKPNLVYHISQNGMDALITHGSVIRAVLDYVCIAMEGRGTVVIGDAPIQGANFDRLLELSGLLSISQFFRQSSDLRVEIVDFRTEMVHLDKEGMIIDKIKLAGDPTGYTTIDIGKDSLFAEVEHRAERFRVTMYDRNEMLKHHSGGVHEYLIPNTVLNSDLIISLTKLKTHRIAGFTGALKSTIGLIGRKDWLPHFCRGSASRGGDQYDHPSFRKWLMGELSDKIDTLDKVTMKTLLTKLRQRIHRTRYRFPYKDQALFGEWHGNDTIWRTILDVFRIIRYADSRGNLARTKPRGFFTIVDGIVSGEGEGPLAPTAKKTGWIIGGLVPVAVDLICSQVMGLDYRKIPHIQNALSLKKLGLFPWAVEDLQIRMWPNDTLNIGELTGISERFVVPEGWQGYLQRSL